MCVNSRLHKESHNCPRKTIKEHHMHTGEGTLLQTSENIISELSLNIEFKEDQILINGRDASGK